MVAQTTPEEDEIIRPVADTMASEQYKKGRYHLMTDENKRSCGSGCNHIKGVCCDVKNCAYHDGESRCTAKEITVGPSYASSSNDTVCATFKPGEGMNG